MKVLVALGALCAGLVNGAALAQPACPAGPLSKLAGCSTGRAFCTSFLGYSAGSSHTLTIETQTTSTFTSTSTKYIASSTVSITQVLPGVTSTAMTTTTTSVSTQTLTVPTGLVGSPTCYISTISEASRAEPGVINVAQASCGLQNKARYVVSQACSCFIDPIVTATATITKTVTVKTTGVPTITFSRYTTTTTTETITTTTASTTSTVSLTVCPTPSSDCNNAGLQWAYYPAYSTDGSSPYNPNNNAGFDPSLYKNLTPTLTGTTQLISIAYTSNGDGEGFFYGEGPEPLSSYVVDHKGYLFVPQTGNYTLDFDYVDDEGYIYLGPTAVSGWNDTNFDYYAYWGTANPGSLTVYFEQGQYVPIRVPFAQGYNAGGFGFDLIAPDGEYVMTSYGPLIASPYVVWRSCDNTTAPAFPVWGQET